MWSPVHRYYLPLLNSDKKMVSQSPSMPYWRLSAYYFLFFATIGIYMPYWPLYLRSINFDAQQIGFIAAITVGTRVFSTYLWSWAADYKGQKMPMVRITSCCATVVFIAVLWVTDFWLLVILMFLFSLFWGASLPQIEAITLSALNNSVHDYSLVRLWGSVGFVFIGCLGIIFASLSIDFLPLILLCSLLLVWLMTLAIPTDKSTQLEHVAGHQEHNSMLNCIKQPQVLALLFICFLMLLSHGPYYTFYSIYLQDNGYSRAMISGLWVLGVIAEIIVFLVMSRLIMFFGLRKLLLFSLFVAGLRWFLIACFVDNLPLLISAQLLHAATFGVWHAVAIQYVHQFFTSRLQARGQGLYNSVSFGAGFAVGTILSGYGWESLGATSCFAIAAVMAFLAMLITHLFIRDIDVVAV
ncbi:Nucleoside:H+ symporter:Major facilitator superfamily [uncultured Candidatus Thioglobus sp.]|nr:Nucleoside:H+ symporter:Major facilitator superfamily [uncultured Candidatus Thioglobus sp.]